MLVWNADFDHGGGAFGGGGEPSERRGSGRKNSMFVNDSIVHIFSK